MNEVDVQKKRNEPMKMGCLMLERCDEENVVLVGVSG